jgi:hypothetical protein
VPEPAMQRSRAAHRQLPGSNRAAELGPSEVDAVSVLVSTETSEGSRTIQ